MKQGINILPIRYFGYLQGFKIVFKDGKKQVKYPKNHGHHYTSLSKDTSKKLAIRDLLKDYGNTNDFYLTYLLKSDLKEK